MSAVLWFTGLSGSGKTTFAKTFAEELTKQGKDVCIIDGDEARDKREKLLGFSREDIRENNRLIAELAREKSKIHDVVLVPVISPYVEDRRESRFIVGDGYIEVFVDCPLEICEKRDAKGLYKKARNGEIENFVGLSELSPYEKPINPDIVINTNETTIEEGVGKLLEAIKHKIKDLRLRI
ncbi:MAG: adenylyl-sulfate kinase [Parcubacteria group bacterium]|nr:adenylyl-sulfate kinase [Parcubacteria group bacterium]